MNVGDLVHEVDRLNTDSLKRDTVDYWSTGAKVNLSFSMVNLSNWAQGGENSISFISTGNLFARYKKNNISFETIMDLSFAIQRLGQSGIRKNDDRIDVNTTFGYAANKVLNYTVMTNFRSQFAPGFNYPNDSVVVSRFFSPAYLVVSAGMEYRPKPWFRLNLSPASGKFTFVTNQLLADAGAFGVKPAERNSAGLLVKRGEQLRYEFGASLFARFTKEIVKNVTLDLKLDLFNGYADDDPKNRGNIDVNSESTLNLKVNKYITTNVFVQVIYDQDIAVPLYEMQNGVRVKVGQGPRTQFKNVTGIGFTMSFQ